VPIDLDQNATKIANSVGSKRDSKRSKKLKKQTKIYKSFEGLF